MRKYKEKQITETKSIPISAICNKCGKEFAKQGENDYFWDAKIHSFSVGFGYGSSFDMEYWQFDLCEDCLLAVIKTFKYVPKGFMLDSNFYLDPERHQKVFEHWKETGEWDELMCHTYEEIVGLQGCFNTEFLNEMIKKYHPGKPLLEED